MKARSPLTAFLLGPLAGPFLASILAPALAADAPASSAAKSSTVLEASLKAGEELEIQLDCGAHVVITGSPEARLHAELSAAAEHWHRVESELQRTTNGHRLRVGGDCEEGIYGLELKLTVADWLPILIRSAGGAIHAAGLEGSLVGETGAGGLHLVELKGAALDLRTGAGNVTLESSTAWGRLETGAGSVVLREVEGEVDGIALLGQVVETAVIHRPPPPGSPATTLLKRPMEVVRKAGNIRLRHVPAGSRIETGAGNVEIGRGEGPLRIRTGAGLIRVASMNGSLTATAETGSLQLRLSEEMADGGPARIELRAPQGDVEVTLPPSLSVRLVGEVIFASRRGPPVIESALELHQSEPQPLIRPRSEGRSRNDRKLEVRGGSPEAEVELFLSCEGQLRVLVAESAGKEGR